jgi:hypothetical protein
MHVKYHLACGVALDLYFKTYGLLTLFSVIPDAPMVCNELRLFLEDKKFHPEEVPDVIFNFYMAYHSTFMIPVIYFAFGKLEALAYTIHIIADWFTHTGRFASMPLYPLSHYQIKFGREILK